MYRPHSGSHHIQLFGGLGFKIFSNIFKPVPQEVSNGSEAAGSGEIDGIRSSTAEPCPELTVIEESENSLFSGDPPPLPDIAPTSQGKHSSAPNISAHSTITMASIPASTSNVSLPSEGTTSEEDILIQLPIDSVPLSSSSNVRNSISRSNSTSLSKGSPAPVAPLTLKVSTSSTQLSSLATPTNRVSFKSNIPPRNSESSVSQSFNGQFQPSFEVQFSEDELKLLREFTEPFDSSNSVGTDTRRAHMKTMNNGILSFSLEFLRDSYSHSMLDEFGNSITSSFSSSEEDGTIVPSVGVPLTLFCSRRLQFAPWEALLNTPTSSTNVYPPSFVPVVRSLSLASLCSAAFDRSTLRTPISDATAHSKSSVLTDSVQLTSRGYLGPHWNHRGVCCVVASDSHRRDSKGGPENHYALNCQRGQLSLRKALSAVFHSPIETLSTLHESDISRNNSSDSTSKGHVYCNFLPHSCLGHDFTNGLKRYHISTSEKMSAEVFPIYLPKNGGNHSDRAHFWDSLFQKLSLSAYPKYSAAVSKSTAQSTCFPIVVFSYVNIIDLPDVFIQLLNQRSDAICLFVPEFAVEKLLVELLSSLQKLNAYNQQVL